MPEAKADELRNFIDNEGPTSEAVVDWMKKHGFPVLHADDDKVIGGGKVFDLFSGKSEGIGDWLNTASQRDIEATSEGIGIKPDFSSRFHEEPQTLYHATQEDNTPSIKQTGIRASNKTRGLTNRSVGSAVFTTTEPETLYEGSYGGHVYEIDTAAMKRDGVLPEVSQEPEVEEANLRREVADRLGYHDFDYPVSSDMWDHTVILHGSVPAKYIKPTGDFMPSSGSRGALEDDATSIQTKSPAFRRWFGDSKAVDVGGNPLVLTHGTKADWNTADTSKVQLGVHLGTPEQSGVKSRGGVSKELFARIENPIRLKDRGIWDFDTVTPQFKEQGIEVPEWAQKGREQFGDAYGKEYNKWSNETLRRILKENGYDGVVYLNESEGVDHAAARQDFVKEKGREPNSRADWSEALLKRHGATDSYIALDPEQVKSATGNNGEFDPGNKDIRFMPDSGKGALEDGPEFMAYAGRSAKGFKEAEKEGRVFKGMYDDKARFEVDDSRAKMALRPDQTDVWRTLGDVLEHPELYKNYPELKGILTHVEIDPSKPYSGQFVEGTPTDDQFFGREPEIHASAPDTATARKVLLHEVQHYIQEKEKFAKGGNPREFQNMDIGQVVAASNYVKDLERALPIVKWVTEKGLPFDEASMRQYAKEHDMEVGDAIYQGMYAWDDVHERVKTSEEIEDKIKDLNQTGMRWMEDSDKAFQKYQHLAGEIESRDVEARADMTPEERKATPPYSGEGIPKDKAVVRGALEEPASFMPDSSGGAESAMSKAQVEDMLQRAWNANMRDYVDPSEPNDPKNWREWVANGDPHDVALVLDSDSEIYHRFLTHIPEDISVTDVLQAYREGKIGATGGIQKKRTGALELTDAPFEPTGKPGEPQSMEPLGEDRIKELWGTANMRATKSNGAAVSAARKALLMQAHVQDVAGAAGVEAKAVNQALRKWSNYPAEARKLSDSLNAGVPEVSRWSGLENSSILSRASVSPEDITPLFKSIEAPESGWGLNGNTIRQYIARALLAIDTRIDYFDLAVKVDKNLTSQEHANIQGQYSAPTRLLSMKSDSPHTMAHELGHYLDHKWALEMGVDTFLSDSSINQDIAAKKTSPERVQWMNRFREFVDDLADRSDTHSEYTQSRKEVFARFIDKFVSWTGKTAGAREWERESYRNDRFTTGDYRSFVKLLQEKAFVDGNDGNPLGIKRSMSEKDASSIETKSNGEAEFMPSTDNPGALEDVDGLGFYSGLRRIVDAKVPNRASGDQILATLKSNGAKAEEMDSMGLPEFLQAHEGPVTKKELQDFMQAGGVQLKEVQKGGKPGTRPAIVRADNGSFIDWADEDTLSPVGMKTIERAGRRIEERPYETNGPTKFSTHVVPGGENYKEVLLTLPEPETDKRTLDDMAREKYGKDFYDLPTPQMKEVHADWEAKNAAQPAGKPAFKEGHWDEANVLAHIRQTDRTDADGNKVRLIEEIQSDWHQKGRKDGYQPQPRDMDAAREALKAAEDRYRTSQAKLQELYRHREESPEAEKAWSDYRQEHKRINDELGRAQEAAEKTTTGVPDGPFKTSWRELAFKRALRMAVEDGMDKVAWTPGEVHTKRWGTERIEWHRQPDGSFLLDAKSQRGGEAAGIDLEAEAQARGLDKSNSTNVSSMEELEDAIRPVLTEGQDPEALAKKLWDRMQSEDQGVSMPRKEGFEGFYDKILPDFVKKYVKKMGGKVEVSSVNAPKDIYKFDDFYSWYSKEHPGGKSRSELQKVWNEDVNNNDPTFDQWRKERGQAKVHSVTITPEMRRAIMNEGQPMFMPGQRRGALEGAPEPLVPRLRTAPGALEDDDDKEAKAKK